MVESEVAPARYNITKLIPPHAREEIRRGEPPLYVARRPDYDRLPLLTFLVRTDMGTLGLVPNRVVRIVKPNNPRAYSKAKLTPGERLLYVCWGNGFAVKTLKDAQQDTYRHIVQPGDPGYDMLDAFKIACDHKRSWTSGPAPFEPDLLYRALGLT